MHRCVAAAAALALTLACAADREPAPRTPGTTLRVATWNVHDLFDEVDRTAAPGDQDTVLPAGAVEAKLALVGRVLARVDADVVVLQEVETLPLLERLAAGPLAGMGYAARLVDAHDPRGIDVGVLARIPVSAYVSHAGERDASGGHLWSRDCVEVHLATGGRPVVVLGNHLVSRRDASQDDRRAEQAARVRTIADALLASDPRRLVLVAGDLNDLPDAPALAALLRDGAWLDAGAALAPGEAWTWGGGGARERIDFVLLPSRDAGVLGRVEVLAGPDVGAASDHRPVVVDLWPW